MTFPIPSKVRPVKHWPRLPMFLSGDHLDLPHYTSENGNLIRVSPVPLRLCGFMNEKTQKKGEIPLDARAIDTVIHPSTYGLQMRRTGSQHPTADH